MSKRKGLPQDMVALSSGILVPRAVHDALLEHVAARIPDLAHGLPYKAKEMVAQQLYAQLDPWQVGYCVADWERTQTLPLRFLGCRYCSVRYYRRT